MMTVRPLLTSSLCCAAHPARCAVLPHQAIRLDHNQPLAHLGYAQVYLAGGGDPTNVVTELEDVLRQLQGERWAQHSTSTAQ